MHRYVVTAIMLLAPALLLAPVWPLAGLGAGEDDLLYYYPMRSLVGDLLAAGHAPRYNPWTGLGRPLLADPQAAVFYPATWLFALLPATVAYGVTVYIHYVIAMAGAYRLGRAQHWRRIAALLAGLAFAFSGFMLAHRPHLTMLCAAAWLPWIFLRLQRCADPRAGRAWIAAGCVIALQFFAGHAQISALTALGAGIWLLAREGPRFSWIWRFVAAWFVGIGLYAIQWAPTLAYVSACTRPDSGYLSFTENSWNPLTLMTWVAPFLLGSRTSWAFDEPYFGPSHLVEQLAYPGWVILLLAAAAIASGRWHQRSTRAWIVLGALGLLIALGLYGPLCPLLYLLPGASLFRVPARALLLAQLALAMLAAGALHGLLAPLDVAQARLRSRLLVLSAEWFWKPVFIVLAMVLLLGLGALFADDETARHVARALRFTNPAIWLPILIGAASLAAVRLVLRNYHRPTLMALLPLVLAADLAIVGWTLDVPADSRCAADLLHDARRDEWRGLIGDDPRRVWVVTRRAGNTPGEYVDSLARGVANTNVLDRVAMLTDYGPLQPRVYVDTFGFEPWGELKTPEARLDDTAWTREAGVGWILLCDNSLPTPRDGRLRYDSGDGLRLFELPYLLRFAWLEFETPPDVATPTRLPMHEIAAVPTPDGVNVRVDLTAVEKGRNFTLRVAALNVPGWTVQLDDVAPRYIAADSLYPGVRLSGGMVHHASFRYQVAGWNTGAAISGLSLLILGLIGSAGRIRKHVAG